MSKTLSDILRSYIPDGDGYNSEYAHNLSAAADALESQQSAPAGYVRVPVDMTQEMYLVFCEERGKHGGTFRSAYKAMLSAAPSAPATVQGDGWIPVSERLPNIVQEVIVNSKFDGITAGFLDSYGEWYSPNSDYKLTRVVAWQPLPAPPAIAAVPKAECTNSDSWNCKYCNKTKDCEALKDPRNFASPKAKQSPVQEPVAEVLVSSGMVVDVVRTQTNLEDGFHRLYAAPQPSDAKAEQPPVQEPVAWLVSGGDGRPKTYEQYPEWAVGDAVLVISPLYAAPQPVSDGDK